MRFLVYSAMTSATIQHNFGEPEYSYYFVLQEFLPLLHILGEVRVIEDPATEVDALYNEALHQGHDCIFLSFSPPHLTCLGLACPTIPVFAWEFDSMPNETWWTDCPEHDWRWCLQQCAAAIVHSKQSAAAVRMLMGDSFPVIDLPAPVWDRMAELRRQPKPARLEIEVINGVLFDTHDPSLSRWLPTEADIRRAVAEARGTIAVDPNRGYRRAPKSIARISSDFLVAWYQEVLAPRLSGSLRDKLDAWADKTYPWYPGRRSLRPSGVVFTSLFNPLDGRKNWMDMLTAFCTEFHDEPEATLIFKLGHRRYEEALEHILMVLPKLGDFQCRVVLLSGFLANHAYRDLIRSSHFTVNTSYGEGQCLPLMEYLSAGKPAVAPQHSALSDYIDSDIAFIIDSAPDATAWPHDPRIAYRTLRQQIDWTSLCKAYRAAFECYREQPETYRAMARAAELRMERHCSLATAAERLSLFLNPVIEKTPA